MMVSVEFIYCGLYLTGFGLQQSLFYSTVYEYIKRSKKKKSGTSDLFSELEILQISDKKQINITHRRNFWGNMKNL